MIKVAILWPPRKGIYCLSGSKISFRSPWAFSQRWSYLFISRISKYCVQDLLGPLWAIQHKDGKTPPPGPLKTHEIVSQWVVQPWETSRAPRAFKLANRLFSPRMKRYCFLSFWGPLTATKEDNSALVIVDIAACLLLYHRVNLLVGEIHCFKGPPLWQCVIQLSVRKISLVGPQQSSTCQ